MPLVSIIMPAYNAEKTIKKSINSVQNQSLTNWELIITDDSSTDKTREIILELGKTDKRIMYLVNNGTSGAWSARNNSIKAAQGQYIAFLDSDDTWLPEKLTLQLDAMVKYNVYASHGTYYRLAESGDVLGAKKASKLVSLEDMLKQNCIGNLTGIYNANVLGKYYQQQIGHEDYAMWLDILKHTDSIGVEQPIANYLVAENSLSSNKFKAAIWHYKILTKKENIVFFKAWYYFVCYIVNAVKSRV